MEVGDLFASQSCPAPLFQHSRQLVASIQTMAAQSLSHLGLHCLGCPFWDCLTYLLQQVVDLEAQ